MQRDISNNSLAIARSVGAGNPDGVEGAQTSRTGPGAPVAETRLTMPQGRLKRHISLCNKPCLAVVCCRRLQLRATDIQLLCTGFGRSNPGVDQTLQFGSFPMAADGMPVLSPVPDRAHSAASSNDQRVGVHLTAVLS